MMREAGPFDKLTDRSKGTPAPELAEGACFAHHSCPQLIMPGIVYTRDVSCFFALFASSR